MENRFEKFSTLILSISRNIQRLKNSEMEKLALKGKYVQCIFVLYSHKKGMSFKQLCIESMEDKSIVSKSVSQLLKEGFIQIEGDQKYKNTITLTQKGLQLGKIINDKINYNLNEASKGITDDERQILYSTLELINKNLTMLNKGEAK